MSDTKPLNEATERELLILFGSVLGELRERGTIRSSNNPVADYAEKLVARALGLTLEQRSSTGCDAHDGEGRRYEIKARRLTKNHSPAQLSVIRQLEKCHFDYLAGVLFSDDFTVQRACLVPYDVVKAAASYRPHVNGWVLYLRPSLWDRSGVRDLTAELIQAQCT